MTVSRAWDHFIDNDDIKETMNVLGTYSHVETIHQFKH